MDTTELKTRRKRLLDELAGRNLDALVVSGLPNVRYLGGFTGSNGVLLISAGAPVLVTDPRYQLQAAQQSDCKVHIARRGGLSKAVAAFIGRRRLKKVGFESSRTLYSAYEELSEAVPRGVELVPISGVVERIRAVKSASEIALIRNSVNTCSRAFTRALRRVRPGITERDLAAEIDHQMRRLGAEKPAFETIVASGARTALPHAEPGCKPLGGNELLLIDMGAQCQGYASDMTRMAYLGRPPRKLRRCYQAVLEAQEAALERVKAGAAVSAVDRAARRRLRDHGLADFFVHSTGHGVGLEVHEFPRIGKADQTRLEAGMVITVEPGVYMEGFGGIRIEDTVLVRDNGCEILTPTPKELVVV